jgi:hypothetical protein
LKGAGNVVRYIVLKGSCDIDAPPVQELMEYALSAAQYLADPLRERKIVN